jgi:hypothetical protein
MDPYFSASTRDKWMRIARVHETNLSGFRTLDEYISLVENAGLQITTIIPYGFERSLEE